MRKTVLLAVLLTFMFSGTLAQSSSAVNVELKKAEPTPLQTSEYADVWLEVTNDGDNSAENVDIMFQETFPFTADPDERTRWRIQELTPGEEYQLHLQVRVDDNAVQGTNTMKFLVNRTSLSYEENVDVEVRSDNDILSAEEVRFPEKVQPGSTNEMSLVLENMADSQLKNIEVALDVSKDSLPLATAEASAKDIERIESGGSEVINFSIQVDEAAENGVYKLPLDLSFENEVGNEFERSLTTGVTVGGAPELEVGINNEETLTPGTTQSITVRAVNRGYGSANFVQMQIQSQENIQVISPSTTYLGDMEPDDFQTAQYRIFIEEDAENLTLPVELNYKDGQGDRTEIVEVQSELYSKEEMERIGISSGSNPAPFVIAALVVVAVLLLYWRRRKKRK